MSEQETFSAHPSERGPSWAAIRDRIAGRVFKNALKSATSGRMRLTFPTGHAVSVGSGGGVESSLSLNNYRVIWRAMRRGMIGFAESYIKRDIETDDLGAVFRFFLTNFEAFNSSGRGLFKVRLPDKIAHLRRPNTRRGSQRNIADHYDLGNDFFALWLDDGLTYSSGIYRHKSDTLEEAQKEKYAAILRAVNASPDRQILEIGCGWGGMAEAIANSGANITAITVSSEQYDYTKHRLENASAKAPGQAKILLQDYRDVSGVFDHIISVEMIEAVGEDNWPTYFKTLSDRLKPGGSAILQAITIRKESFAQYQRTPDFIQRYIFPGGMLPTVEHISAFVNDNNMSFSTIERFGQSYAQTLRDWRDRFDNAWPQISALGYDENFRRMWRYYLTYCEVGFERGLIDVGLYRLTKPVT